MTTFIFPSMRVPGWTLARLLACVMLLAFVARGGADYKPLTKEEQAKVDKAIERGVAFLKGSQTEAGDWKGKLFEDRFLVGQCALPAYALLESGVPPDDPVIQKAAEYIRSRILATDQTYELSLAILFFDRLGDPKDGKLIPTLALRLIAGQKRMGGWAYSCPSLNEEEERELLKSLGSLNKRMEASKSNRRQALEGFEPPASSRFLTVFEPAAPFVARDRRKTTDWFSSSADNSNSQFGLMGLWVAGRHRIPVKPTFEIMVEYYERTQNYPSGKWNYFGDGVHNYAHGLALLCPWA